MQYIWIIMLAIADLIWIIASIVEVIHVIKRRLTVGEIWSIDPIAKACAIIHLVILFIVSFFMWLFG